MLIYPKCHEEKKLKESNFSNKNPKTNQEKQKWSGEEKEEETRKKGAGTIPMFPSISGLQLGSEALKEYFMLAQMPGSRDT